MNTTDLDPRRSGQQLLAIVLWAATSALAFVEILTVREIVLRIYAHFAATGGFYGPDYFGGATLAMLTTIAMALACVVVMVGGGEYHYRNFGKPTSWRLFARTLAVELSVLILALFV